MGECRLEETMLQEFRAYLSEEEKSQATISKYLRDIQAFFRAVGIGGTVTKETVMEYKEKLVGAYAPASVNSMLAAVNRFLDWRGWAGCMVKTLKIQREIFRDKERELTKSEYLRLLKTARKEKRKRLGLIMETLGCTGIRIGELRFITVEAVKNGQATVTLKRKTRRVLIPKKLCQTLQRYIKEQKIKTGSVFVTRGGKPVDRSNVLHEMKGICELAGVEKSKVFPHNFRHLFACIFYQTHRDLSRLADLLGHSNINTTRIYICVNSDEHARQIEVLGLVT